MTPGQFEKSSCGLCERPVAGVHYLWDTLTGRETIMWFHGEEDQCFKDVSYGPPVTVAPDFMEKTDENP